jgi:hypothetical protein
MIVGPQAYVRLYNQADPDATLLWLLPRQSVGDVVDLHIDDAVDSLDILEKAPEQGDVGYDAYVTVLKAATQTKN